MENIVIMGAGENLRSCIKRYSKYFLNKEKYNIVAIWDNDSSKVGNTIIINNNIYKVEKPGKIEPIPTILISSEKYYEEIKKDLLNNDELLLDSGRIHYFSYLERDNKKRLIEKYKESKDEEIQRILRYLEAGGELKVFMDVPSLKQLDNVKKFDVEWDDDVKLYYSFWDNKRIYLKRSINTRDKAEGYLTEILLEQVEGSPHCYNREGFAITNKDVLVDAGAAEGFFALENIDVAKKIILVESDSEWVEALKYTFKDYENKVEIIMKELSDCTNLKKIQLDDIDTKDNPITFIKMDIEGAERKVLESASIIGEQRPIRIIACTYHHINDQIIIEKILNRNGFKTSFSKGYMYFNLYEDDQIFDLRRGLCFGVKTGLTNTNLS